MDSGQILCAQGLCLTTLECALAVLTINSSHAWRGYIVDIGLLAHAKPRYIVDIGLLAHAKTRYIVDIGLLAHAKPRYIVDIGLLAHAKPRYIVDTVQNKLFGLSGLWIHLL